jgi:hypothetical protein
MTGADLARWAAQSDADSAPGMHEELRACIAEVRRLRAILATRCAQELECQDDCAAKRQGAPCALAL